MMLALVKCFLWIMKRAAETGLVFGSSIFHFTFHLSLYSPVRLKEVLISTGSRGKETVLSTGGNGGQITLKLCRVIRYVILVYITLLCDMSAMKCLE